MRACVLVRAAKERGKNGRAKGERDGNNARRAVARDVPVPVIYEREKKKKKRTKENEGAKRKEGTA